MVCQKALEEWATGWEKRNEQRICSEPPDSDLHVNAGIDDYRHRYPGRLFYSFVLDYLPGGVAAGNDENMTMWDWVWIVTVSAISVMISLF